MFIAIFNNNAHNSICRKYDTTTSFVYSADSATKGLTHTMSLYYAISILATKNKYANMRNILYNMVFFIANQPPTFHASRQS